MTSLLSVDRYGADGMRLLASANANASTSVEAVWTGEFYDTYMFFCMNVLVSNNGAQMRLRTTGDGGLTWSSGGSDYATIRLKHTSDGVVATNNSGAANHIKIASSIGNAANRSGNSVITIYTPYSSIYPHISYDSVEVDGGADVGINYGGGSRLSSAFIDGVQVFLSAGTITAGQFYLYGVNS